MWKMRRASTLRWCVAARFWSWLHTADSDCVCASAFVQNLACGVFQMTPKEEPREVSLRPSDFAGASGSGGADEDEAKPQQLLLPTQQTAAVTAAKLAGRKLVSEVDADGPDGDVDDDDAPNGPTAKRLRSEAQPSRGDAHVMAGGGIGAGARPRRELAPAAATSGGGGSGGDGSRH